MPEQDKLYDIQTLVQTHHADEAFLKEMVLLFIKHIPVTNFELKKASAAGDWQNVYFYAHKMKASIDLFSILQLKTLIREVEQNAKHSRELEKIPAQVSHISEVIEQCLTAMKKEFNVVEE